MPANKYTQPQAHPSGEQIFLNYGFGVLFSQGGSLPTVTPPSTAMPANQFQIESNTYSMVQRFNNMVGAPIQYVSGYLPFQQSFTLNGGMVQSQLNTALINNPQGAPNVFPQPYVPALARAAGKFGVSNSATWNLLVDNYQSDDYPEAPLPTTACDVTLLNTITGKTASVVTVKNNPGAYLFDNGDEAFVVRRRRRPAADLGRGAGPGHQRALPHRRVLPADPGLHGNPARAGAEQPALRLRPHHHHGLPKPGAAPDAGGIPELLTLESQLTPELPFSRLGPSATNVIAPPSDRLDFHGAYGLYFWEIFFHAPFLVADSLSNNQRYAEAKDWYEYIFNPTQQPEGDSGADAKRYWRFLPLRDMTIQSLTQILTDPAQIAAYNNDPFDPDAIARLRTTAYAKAVVMKYIRNLLAWGDFLRPGHAGIHQPGHQPLCAGQPAAGAAPGGSRRLLGAGADELQRHQAGVQQPQHHHRRRRRRHGQYPDAGRHRRRCPTPMPATVHHLRQGANQSCYITGYDAANKRLTVEIGWNPVPDTSSQYRVYANGIPEFLIRLENTPMALPRRAGRPTRLRRLQRRAVQRHQQLFLHPREQRTDRLLGPGRRPALQDPALHEPRRPGAHAGPVRAADQPARTDPGGARQRRLARLAAPFSVPIPYYRFASLIERARADRRGLPAGRATAVHAGKARWRSAGAAAQFPGEDAAADEHADQAAAGGGSKQGGLALNQSLQSAQKRQSWYRTRSTRACRPMRSRTSST